MTRICITGGPRTGKTTLAEKLSGGHSCGCASFDRVSGYVTEADCDCPGRVRSTDSLICLGWSEASRASCSWLDNPDPWIIEGVAVSRALRKWRDAHPAEPPPVDRVIYLSEPHETLTPGQAAMAKGVRTVHDEIDGWLVQHGIRTEYPMIPHQKRGLSMYGVP